ncbi:MAG: helix-turn-helix domain-containing protein [Clostridia bacterium]|nr:helix-turn-helix domain-containing protein [Clostridia bacterium]
MAVNRRIDAALARLTLKHREEDFRHHTYDEDMAQYEYVKRGDMRAIEVGRRMFEGPTTGSVSDDPVRNYQYLFVASITLACRFCIEGGMPTEDAFNLSDLYIRQLDRCRTVEEIFALHDTMFRDYTGRMQALGRQKAYSRPVRQCLDHIGQHLQQPLTVRGLADALGLAPTYLSALFKKETGLALSEYIRRARVDTACTLLRYTDFSCLEIAEYLCFSSDSHFSQVFRQHTGQTPRDYRRTHAGKHWEEG